MTRDTINNIIQHNRRDFAVHQLWAEMERLRTGIRNAALVFRRYENRHLAKNTPEAARKAQANALEAEKLEELL